MSVRDRWLVAGVLGVAWLARVAAIGATLDYSPISDDRSYDDYARSIAAGEGYPDSRFAPAGGPSAFWPPGYPYFLAGVHALLGHGWHSARLVQTLLGVATVALVGVLAWQLAGRRAALLSMAIAAVYPPLVLQSATLYTEVLFVPLVLATVVAAVAHVRSPRGLGLPVAIGVLGGLATLTRPVAVFMLVPVALALALRGRGGGLVRAARAPAAMALAVLATTAPWVARNAVVMDEPMLSTNLDYVLAGTYNETARSDERYPAAWRPPNLVREHAPLLAPASGLDEQALAERFREEALEFAGEHPLYPLKVAWLNTLRTLDLYGGHDRARLVYQEQGFGPRAADSAIYSFYAVGLLALAGALTAAARRVPAFVWAVPVLLLLGAVVGQGVSRYRLPLEPFLVLLAALAVLAAGERLLRRRSVAA